MISISYYKSPLGTLLLASKHESLIGLWIEGQKYYASTLKEEYCIKDDEETLIKAKDWLDRYFRGEKPDIEDLRLEPTGSEFSRTVWELLKKIPYGTVTTYGSLAKLVAEQNNQKQMSAQAIGWAVSHNPISIIIPCHRVVGVSGSLTGYAGGIENKIKLLELEQVDLSKRYRPKQ